MELTVRLVLELPPGRVTVWEPTPTGQEAALLYFDGLGGLILLGVWVFCFIDVVMTPESACRNLPKLAWVFIVLLFSVIGSIAWLVAGRPWDRTAAAGQQQRGANGRYPEYDRPGRYVPTNPDDDEEFLAGLRKRAEEQRRRAREQSRDPDSNGPRDSETD